MSYLRSLLFWTFGSLVLMLLLFSPSSNGGGTTELRLMTECVLACNGSTWCSSVICGTYPFTSSGSSTVWETTPADVVNMAFMRVRWIVVGIYSRLQLTWNMLSFCSAWAAAPLELPLTHPVWTAVPPLALTLALVAPLIWCTRALATVVIDLSNRVVYNPRVRDVFFRTAIPDRSESSSHTHPAAARGRSLVSEHSQLMARRLDMGWYSYQMSYSEVKRGEAGERTFYWSKDVNITPKFDKPLSGDLKVLLDVASHVELPSLLTKYPGAFYLYDVLPESACYVSNEVSYCFNEEGEIVYDVSGGARYKHKLWSYDSDTLTVASPPPFWGPVGWAWQVLFGVTSVYSVERRKVAPNRGIVLFNPKGRWHGLFGVVARCFLSHDWLHRFNPVVGDYARFKVQNELGWHYTTARLNQYCGCTIPVELDGLMCERATTAQVGITPYLLEGCLSKWSGDKAQAAAVMAAYLKANGPREVDRVSLTNVHNYQFEPYNSPAVPRPVVVQFMRGMFVDGAFSPDRGVAGQAAAVKGRILKPAKDIANCKPFVRDCMADFISEFRRESEARIHPVSFDEVWSRQAAPSQRRILADAARLFQKLGMKIKTFVKAESYGKLTHPRIISQINPKEKADNSRFTYALSEYIKQRVERFPWYTCGMTPAEISRRVVAVLKQCGACGELVAMTDGSRLDGTISELANDFLHALLGHVFCEEYAEELHDLIDALVHQKCTFARDPESGQSVHYDSKWARLSGSPWTSIANTLWTAFGSYLALRHKYATLPRNEAHVRAWVGLGTNLGDDGLSEDAGAASWEFAAQQTGIDFEVETAGPGMRVSYLARIFGPDAWNGCEDSCCDLLRTLGKLHVVPANADGTSPAFKLISKALGLIVSDANTPVVGTIVRKIFELADADRDADRAKLELKSRYGLDYAREKHGRAKMTDAYGPLWKAGYMNWWAAYSNEEQWPNHYGEWMSDYAEKCGLSLVKLQSWAIKVTTLRQFMDTAPLIAEAMPVGPPVLPVAMDGVIRYPEGYVIRMGGENYVARYSKESGHWVMSWVKENAVELVPDAPPAPAVPIATGNEAAPMDNVPVPEDLYKSASDPRGIKSATKEVRKFVKLEEGKVATTGGKEKDKLSQPLGHEGSSPAKQVGDGKSKPKPKKKKKKSKAKKTKVIDVPGDMPPPLPPREDDF